MCDATKQCFSIDDCHKFPLAENVFLYDRISFVCKNGISQQIKGGKGLRTHEKVFGMCCKICLVLSSPDTLIRFSVSPASRIPFPDDLKCMPRNVVLHGEVWYENEAPGFMVSADNFVAFIGRVGPWKCHHSPTNKNCY
uniref:Uncharacterized protein n=1 Tax=Romanomermis culicivorax TaxID=13658 RepID=A0A915J639_ROMCU